MINSTELNIEQVLKKSNINIDFVKKHQENIYKYFIQNAPKIREEFLKRPTISVNNRQCEYVKYKSKKVGLVPSLDIANNVIAENNFLTNIVKCCLYILEINMTNVDEISFSDLIQQIQMKINDCYLQKFEEWIRFLIFVPSVYESYMTFWVKNDNGDFFKNIYFYPIKNGLIQSSIEDDLTFGVKNSNSNFMILKSQMIDYLYLMINMFFFLNKKCEKDYRDYLPTPIVSNIDMKSYIFYIRLKFVISLSSLICILVLRISYKYD